MPAQIVFLTMFLGIVARTQPIALQVSGPVESVRILLGGREVAALHEPPWRTTVDFGADLTPRELTAVGFDAKGNEIARATQFVNLPRPTAEFQIIVDGNHASLRWRHLTNAKPERATISFDGKPLAVGPTFHARLPKFDLEMPHVIAAEMRFADGFVTRRELVIESVRSDIIGTELTPVLVRETSPAHPKTWEGCLARMDGRPIRTAAVEKPRALVLFVRDPDPHDAEASIVSPTRVRPGLARDTVKRMLSLDRETIGRVIWPVTQRFANEDQTTSALFEPSNDVDMSNKDVLWLLQRHYGDDDAHDVQKRFTDAVAVAGVRAATGSQRRAVVYVLSSNDDASGHRPAAVRRYLEALGVPLFVWSLTGPRPDLAATWGDVDDVSNVVKLGDAVKRVRDTLLQQRIAWVNVDPLTALHLRANEKCGIETVAR